MQFQNYTHSMRTNSCAVCHQQMVETITCICIRHLSQSHPVPHFVQILRRCVVCNRGCWLRFILSTCCIGNTRGWNEPTSCAHSAQKRIGVDFVSFWESSSKYPTLLSELLCQMQGVYQALQLFHVSRHPVFLQKIRNGE
jgi:hypothetical protein